MKIYSRFDRPQVAGLTCEDESLTQQQFKDECDIDCILRRYDQTGVLVDPLSERRLAQFGDFSNLPSFAEYQNRLAEVSEYFMSLPPDIRSNFANDVGTFIEAIGNPDNESKLIELGILEKVASEPSEPPVTPSGPIGKVEPLPVNPDAPAVVLEPSDPV